MLRETVIRIKNAKINEQTFLGFSEESGKLRDPSKSAVGSSLASFLTFLAGVTCSSSLISFFLLIVWSFPES